MQSFSKPITTCRILTEDIFSRFFFLLSKTVLGDSATSILLSQPEYTEAARISDILELINKTMET